jgi:signal peptidase I
VNKEVPIWLARTVTVTALVVGVALLVFLWPIRLGGSSELLVVHGDSMQPTFDHGDIVLVRRSGDYDVGDTVAFRVPTGPAEGMRVVHRIVVVDATTGRLTTRGDARTTADHFEITALDVEGRVLGARPVGRPRPLRAVALVGAGGGARCPDGPAGVAPPGAAVAIRSVTGRGPHVTSGR